MKSIGNLIWKIIESVAIWCLKVLFIILHQELTEEIIEAFLQFIKFGLVGLSNTLLSYFLNIIVLLILRPYKVNWDYFAGNTISFIISVAWSFYWNNKYVFVQEEGKSRSIWKVLLKTYASYAITGLILANVLSWFWISICGISKYIAPLLNLIISVPLNFFLNKLWAFKSE